MEGASCRPQQEPRRTGHWSLLRGGRSEAGQVAALSHTGSIAGADEVAIAVLRQAGIELVDRSDELAVVAGALATAPPLPFGTGVVVLSDGGGHATLAADALVAQNVALAALAESTRAELRALTGGSGALANPIDIDAAGAAASDPGVFSDAIDILLRDLSVGLVLVIGLYGGYHKRFDSRFKDTEERDAARVAQLAKSHAKQVVVHSCYAYDDLTPHQTLRANGVPVIGSIDHAIRAVAALAHRGQRLATAEMRSDLVLPVNRSVTYDGEPALLSEPAARRLLESQGITTGEWRMASSVEELEIALNYFRVPCAVKIVADGVSHKSDAGGVRLNVVDNQAAAVWEGMLSSIDAAAPHAVVHGVLVAPMAPPGVEVLVGAHRDSIFGPIVAFGSGGFFVEAVRDVSFRAAPFTGFEAAELVDETAAARLLGGYRNLPAVDRTVMVDLLVAVGDLMVARPEIVELDLNPVIASGADLFPVDVRIAIREATR